MQFIFTKLTSTLIVIALIVFGYFIYTALGGTTIGVTLTTNPDLRSGLVGHWTFDGKDIINNIADISGQGNTGYLNGQTSTTTAPGVLGQALEFDGSDDRIDISDSPSLDITNAITITAWVFLDSTFTDTYPKIVSKGNPEVYQLFIDHTTSRGYSATVRVGASVYDVNSMDIQYDTWRYLTMTYDGETLKIYLEGKFSAENATPSGNIDTNDSNVVIGNRLADARHWDGLIDDVRIYNRALSAEEVTRLYDLGSTTHVNVTLDTNPDLDDGLVGHWTFDGPDMYNNAADTSGQGNTGYLTNFTSTTTAPGVLGQALEFDGVNDNITVPPSSSINNLPTITLSAWVRPRSEGENNFGYILEKSNTDVNGFRFRLQNLSGSNPGELAFRIDHTTDVYRYSVNNVITLNEWQHVLVTWDGTTSSSGIHLYVNGSEVLYRLSQDGSGTQSDDSGNNLIIGQMTNGDRTVDGFLDDVRVYNRALSSDEITRLYDLGR